MRPVLAHFLCVKEHTQMQRSIAVIVLALAALGAAPTVSADDWPNWRGPTYDGSSAEKGLLQQWPKEGPKIVWKAPILRGWSCPSVSGGASGGEVFVFGSELHGAANPQPGSKDGPDNGKYAWGEKNNEVLQCLDAATGKEKWRYVYQSSYGYGYANPYTPFGPRSTPTVTPDKVFIMDMVGMFTCLDRKTGAKVWARDLAAEFKRDLDGQRGWNNNPIVSGKVVILNMPCGNKPRDPFPTPKCIGMDIDTGKTVWLFDEPHRPNNAPCNVGGDPVLSSFLGQPCVVFCVNRTIRALRAADGKEVWKSDHQRDGSCGSNTPSLLPVGNTFLQLNFLDSSYLVEVDRQNPALPTRIVWAAKDIHTNPYQCSNFVYSNGCYFGFINQAGKSGEMIGASTLTCLDGKTGKVAWSKTGFGTTTCLITADGLLFARDFNTLLLLEATPTGYVEKGRVHPLQTFTNDPPQTVGDAGRDNGFIEPVLSRGYLYVRGPTELICFDVAERK
jgi:outer membrane protein assembly factor BamB